MEQTDAFVVTAILKWNVSDKLLTVSDIINTVLLLTPVVKVEGEGEQVCRKMEFFCSNLGAIDLICT